MPRPVDRPQEREIGLGVNPRELLLGRIALDRLAGEPEQPVLALGMIPRRMEVRKRRVRQEVDSASSRPANLPSPHVSASAAARSHVGSWSSSGGNGASASIVATCR